jgi:hypothetical protein
MQISFYPNKGSHLAGDYSVIAAHKIVASRHGDNTDGNIHKHANNQLRLTSVSSPQLADIIKIPDKARQLSIRLPINGFSMKIIITYYIIFYCLYHR